MKRLAVSVAMVLWAVSTGGCETNVEPCDFECNFECVDLLTDPVNCGGCGVVCPAGTSCENGQCECPGTNELCDGVCLDVLTDRLNCGGCGVMCTYDSQCVVGECDEYLEPYGTMSVDFSTAFIFDGARFFAEAGYQSDNWDAGVTETPTATGTYGAALGIPGATATNGSDAVAAVRGPRITAVDATGGVDFAGEPVSVATDLGDVGAPVVAVGAPPGFWGFAAGVAVFAVAHVR